jgi:hypothetical protein
MKFKTWIISEELNAERQEELQRIWADTFKALGVGGLSDEDAAQMSLSKIVFNQRTGSKTNSPFKGKQAARKRLENGQIFSRLEKLNDPEVKKNIENVRKWLDTQDPGHAANASTTVSSLLQKLFGQETFQKFIDADFPQVETKPEVPPQPPKQDVSGPEAPVPDNQGQPPAPPGGPEAGMLGQQPPAPAGPEGEPKAQVTMPPKPAGAELGLF